MNNIEKKLDALIDALGFDVETTLDYEERKITKESAAHYFVAKPFGHTHKYKLQTENVGMCQASYLVDSDGMYTESLTDPIVDYKVTKKDKGIFMGNWKGTDIFIQTEQEDELRELIAHMGANK